MRYLQRYEIFTGLIWSNYLSSHQVKHFVWFYKCEFIQLFDTFRGIFYDIWKPKSSTVISDIFQIVINSINNKYN